VPSIKMAKGVDVEIAVDLIMQWAEVCDRIVLLSGDSDFPPALLALPRRGVVPERTNIRTLTIHCSRERNRARLMPHRSIRGMLDNVGLDKLKVQHSGNLLDANADGWFRPNAVACLRPEFASLQGGPAQAMASSAFLGLGRSELTKSRSGAASDRRGERR